MADCPCCAADEHAERQRGRYGAADAYEPCFACKGSTLESGLVQPVSCTACRGQGWVRRRDDRGRFVAAGASTEGSRDG